MSLAVGAAHTVCLGERLPCGVYSWAARPDPGHIAGGEVCVGERKLAVWKEARCLIRGTN